MRVFPSRFPQRLNSTHSHVTWYSCDYSRQRVLQNKEVHQIVTNIPLQFVYVRVPLASKHRIPFLEP